MAVRGDVLGAFFGGVFCDGSRGAGAAVLGAPTTGPAIGWGLAGGLLLAVGWGLVGGWSGPLGLSGAGGGLVWGFRSAELRKDGFFPESADRKIEIRGLVGGGLAGGMVYWGGVCDWGWVMRAAGGVPVGGLKAPFSYVGGKQRLVRWIAERLPERKIYVEPFGGMGSVLLGRRPVWREVFNDLDENVFCFWLAVRDDPGGLERLWGATPDYSFGHWEEALVRLGDSGLSVLERAYFWSVAVKMTFMGISVGGYGGFSRSFGVDSRSPLGWPDLGALAGRLREVFLWNMCGVELLERVAGVEDQVVYVDPPYPSSKSVKSYAHVPDFGRLEGVLLAQRGAVMVSGLPGDWPGLVEGGWEEISVPAVRQSITPRRGDVFRRVEAVWVNFGVEAVCQGELFLG